MVDKNIFVAFFDRVQTNHTTINTVVLIFVGIPNFT